MIDKTLLDEIIIGRVEPRIYAFTTNTIPNYLKVGDTYRPVSIRLKEWEEHYPNLEKMFEGEAKVDEVYFRDFAVHQFLETEKNRLRLQPSELPAGIYYSKEFFKDATADDVQEAITDIQRDYYEKSLKYQFYSVETLRPANTVYPRTETYDLRPNQKKTVEAFRQAIDNGRTNLLMYAVMRFGKSFTSMCCAVEMGANLVVVVSGKADVLTEWKKTVESHVKFDGYEFLTAGTLSNNNHAITEKLNSGKKVVVFLTLQDLQGEQIKDKHQEVFGQDIDLLLVDETHFGARAEKYGEVLRDAKNYETDVKNKKDSDDFVDVDEANKTIKTLKARVTIHLSGTPYRILMGSEFKKEDIIAFYQFTDIVDEQQAWDKEHILDDEYREWDNPYYGFPQMVRFAFHPSESSRKQLEELKKNGTTYAFSALFKPKSIKKSDDGSHKKFIYEKEILDLLEVIDGSKEDDELLGFLDYDKIKEGKMCRHIVIVLPYCASCDALEELIKTNKNRFRNLGGYEIVNISGVDNPNAYKSPKVIQSVISSYESEGKKTITLTVNRMLTGSTVPEWDTMLYLKDTASPQEYDQAVFRLQNQYIRQYKSEDRQVIKYNMKPQTLLVDFDPNRMFVMQEKKSKIYNANVDTGGNSELEKRISKELEISPIIVLNKDKIVRVVATDILEAVSNYQRDKGIKDEALEIPVDLSILDDSAIRAVIELENEIGSKSGLSAPAYSGEDDGDGDEIDIPTEEPTDESGDIPTSATGNTPAPTDDKRKQEISLTKKVQSYYTRILLFAFITKDTVISLSQIIEKMETEENARIAKNLGLNKDILTLLTQKTNKFVLSDLDYKIQDLNGLSKATDLSPVERAQVAVNKFGKLGDAIVITPSNICDDMVNLLPEEFIKSLPDSGGKILDIAGTTGEFAVALHKRMTELGLDKGFIANAIYTIPKSSVCYELTRKLYELLGLNTANIAKEFIATDMLKIKLGEDIDYEKIKALLTQNKPFETIKLTDTPIEGEDKMKFDAIVGNPPYQEDDGGAQKSARPIYNYFVKIGKKLHPKHFSMIMPTRWFAGGKGKELDSLRSDMLNDKHIKELHDFLHPEELFPDTNNRGGICYFLWADAYDNTDNLVNIITHEGKGKTFTYRRSMKTRDLDIFIRDSKAIGILDKVIPNGQDVETLETHISAAKAFGFRTFFIRDAKFRKNAEGLSEPIKCYGRGNKIGYVEKSEITSHQDWISCWKVYVPESNNIGTELNDDNQNSFVGAPNTICTETFLVVGADLALNEYSANNLCLYLKTRFARYLLSLAKISQHGTAKTYRFVPVQDFSSSTEIDWSKSIPEIDQQLYRKYGLSTEEISFIESMIKPMGE
ncbi:MAG: Eco57I restriction-modification methylase domain-containing protein [Candidatus Coproplasma sp.]